MDKEPQAAGGVAVDPDQAADITQTEIELTSQDIAAETGDGKDEETNPIEYRPSEGSDTSGGGSRE